MTYGVWEDLWMPYGVWGNPMGLTGALGGPYRVWKDPMGVNGALGRPYGGLMGSGRTSG